ncbi:EF-hand domain-containing protein [Rhodovulum sp. BSW8]|uniref:EF-hand domain-containing protein n=1 Tax=Rhodovulum sp. BSW8 TaxID=2259645 RepID=UPI001403F194|nr:EF-hand domain-containing protein [Rhodovulum sp. BSW8]
MRRPIRSALALSGFALALAAGSAAADTQRAPILYEKWDADRSGTINRHELQSQARHIFAAFDTNGDGHLDATEAAAFDRARGPLAYFRGEEAYERKVVVKGQKLMRNDLDGNGRIELSEFRMAANEWLAMHDRDGDGRLTLWDVSAR